MGAPARTEPARAWSVTEEQVDTWLFDGVKDYAIFMLDPEGHVATWNMGAELISGYASKEIIGAHFSRFYAPEEVERRKPYSDLAAATAEGRFEVEGWRLRKDGSRYWANVVVTALHDDVGELRGFLQLTRDETDRIQIEMLLRRSEERFRLLVENVKDYAIFMLDPDGSVISWNTGAELMTGYTSEEILGRHFSCLYSKEEVAEGKPEEELGVAVDEGRFEAEGWRIRKDGSRFWASAATTAVYDEDGRLRGFAKVTRDVTEQNAAREALRESEERFRRLVESVKDYAILMLDRDGRVTSWNPGAEAIHGFTGEEILGRHFSCFYAPEDVSRSKPEMDIAAAVAAGRFEEERWRVRSDGSRFTANVVITPVYDESDRLVGFSKVTQDVTMRKQLQEQLEHQALHDPLTGLPNRTLFLERLRQALTRLERYPHRLAVFFLDVDRFKVINDSLGHEVGDQLLVALTERLKRVLRPEDTIARFGGDEMALLCEGIHDEHFAVTIAERVARALRDPLPVGDREMVVSASIGIAMAHDASAHPERLIADADAAMYRAKERGRGRCELFDAEMRARAMQRLETETALRQALINREFRLFFQPLVDLQGGVTTGYEALLRWQHPERGLLGPTEFVSLAEETGLIVPLGEWALRQACHHAVDLEDVAGMPVTMSVNLSFAQVAQPELPRVVARALKETKLEPSRLCLELTESVILDEEHQTTAILSELKDLGVKLALDDFGTGYSSLSCLQKFPVDTVKIDRHFVAGLGTDPEGSAIVAAVIKIGDVLDLGVVAEGVENMNQLSQLVELGCHVGQGYFFARPQPADMAFPRGTGTTG